MNTILEILENDHIAIRLFSRCFGNKMDLESFKSFHEFIVEVHAKIEDDMLFPVIKDQYKEDDDIRYLVERIASDHLLLSNLGKKIIEYGEKGETELFSRRLERYMLILIDHNKSEENLLFPLWKRIPENIRRDADKKASELVSKFGYGKFTKILQTLKKNL